MSLKKLNMVGKHLMSQHAKHEASESPAVEAVEERHPEIPEEIEDKLCPSCHAMMISELKKSERSSPASHGEQGE